MTLRSFLALSGLWLACGSQGGSVGALLVRDSESRRILIEEAPVGLAAQRAGIERGDELIAVDGVHVSQLTVEELRRRLRGEIGTEVRLTIARGDKILRLAVHRSPLATPAPRASASVQKLQE